MFLQIQQFTLKFRFIQNISYNFGLFTARIDGNPAVYSVLYSQNNLILISIFYCRRVFISSRCFKYTTWWWQEKWPKNV